MNVSESVVLMRIQKRFDDWLDQMKKADHYLEVRELLNVIPAHLHVQQAIKIIKEEIAQVHDRRVLILELDSGDSYSSLEGYIKMALDGRGDQIFAEEDAYEGIHAAVLFHYEKQFRSLKQEETE
jgi:hypothetical protein